MLLVTYKLVYSLAKLESGTRFMTFCLRNEIHFLFKIYAFCWKGVECSGDEIKVTNENAYKSGGSFFFLSSIGFGK